MKSKKSGRANIENYRTIFLLTGVVIALLVSITILEYKVSDKAPQDMDDRLTAVDDEVIPITRIEPEAPSAPSSKSSETNERKEVENKEEDESGKLDIPEPGPEPGDGEEVEPVGMEIEGSDEPVPFILVESAPVFPGCEDLPTVEEKRECLNKGIIHFVSDNFQIPRKARRLDIQGRVFVNFVIEKDGSISNIKVVRGVDPVLDDEAVRVVKGLPKFEPARQHGKPVRVSYTLPINARLD